MRTECLANSVIYKKRHQKLKRKDQLIEGFCSILNASSITLILSTPTVPPLFIGSAVCSSLQFVLSRVQEKMKWKDKYHSFLTTSNQYYALASEINVVLHKNHLTNEQYESYIEEVSDKTTLIRDSQIF
jgi:hypothetical protein